MPDTPLSSVTVLIHTADRPQFLYRLLRYIQAAIAPGEPTIVVADGSGARDVAAFDALAATLTAPFDLQRYPPALPFMARLGQALDSVRTPYVLLAADDDFFFQDWLAEAVRRLDTDRDVEVCGGDYLRFTLGRFAAFGDDVSVREGTDEHLWTPYLEDATAEERLREYARGRSGLHTLGWYALHRTETLRRMVACAARHALTPGSFERFLTVAQAAAGKTVISARISHARQGDLDTSRRQRFPEPAGYRANHEQVEGMLACSRSFMEQELGFPATRADTLTELGFGNEVAMMRQADRRRFARRLVNRTPGARPLLEWVRARSSHRAWRDPRVSQRPDPGETAAKTTLVEQACRAPVGAEG